MEPRAAADRGQLEDAQDGRPRPRRSSQALLPRVPALDGVDVALCAAVHGAGRDGRQRAAARAWWSTRRTCTRRRRAPSPARSRRRCSPSPACTASCSATPSAASTSARPTRRSPEGARRAGRRPAAGPLRRRDRGGARRRATPRRKLRHQLQEDLAGVADGAPGELAIAYEPIWAIGTGQVGDARAGPGGRRLRPRARRRPEPRAAADAVRVLYGGSVKPENVDELLAHPTSTARWSAARASMPTRSPRSCVRPRCDPRHGRAAAAWPPPAQRCRRPAPA